MGAQAKVLNFCLILCIFSAVIYYFDEEAFLLQLCKRHTLKLFISF